MKCIRCGFEVQEDFNFCPICRQQQTPVETVSINPSADRVMAALKDGLFLAICVLMTVYCGLSIVSGSFSIISVLITIFLWCVFSQAGKGIVNENQLRNVSGTVYAAYIVNNIAFVILAICGVLMGATLSWAIGTDEFGTILSDVLAELEISGLETSLTPDVLSLGGWVFVVIMAIFVISAVFGLIINILGMRKIHRFIKSVYQSVMYNTPNFIDAKGAKNWLMFFGIYIAITAVIMFWAEIYIMAAANAIVAAVQIIASVLINKYFISSDNNL